MGKGAEAQAPNSYINRAWEGHCEAPITRRAQGERCPVRGVFLTEGKTVADNKECSCPES